MLSTLLFLTGCADEPPTYDLSKIPQQEEASAVEESAHPSPENKAPPPPPLEDKTLADNDCAPPPNQNVELTPENSVQLTVSLDNQALGQQVLVDVIESEYGEVKYGLVCSGKNPTLTIPQMLGSVRVVVFIDGDKNGPSKNDTQGMTDIFTITKDDINIPEIVWSESPLPFYNFDNPTAPNVTPPPKDDEQGAEVREEPAQ